MHFGHANAFRQARALGTYVIAGINPDKEIIKYKQGPPIMNEEERKIVVQSCKWVDEVVENVPYIMNEKYIQYIINKYNVDYIVHGDDPCIAPDGTNVFDSSCKLDIFRTIKRTEGVSTTNIIGRILTMHDYCKPTTVTDTTISLYNKSPLSINKTKYIHSPTLSIDESNTVLLPPTLECKVSSPLQNQFAHKSELFPTMWRFTQFATPRPPTKDDVIVYVDGTWDMFHSGHVEFLQQCRKFGTYVLAGIYSDHTAHTILGYNYPILNIYERSLSLLSCKYIDDIILGAPRKITKDLITTFNIQVVCSGDLMDSNVRQYPYTVDHSPRKSFIKYDNEKDDPYYIPKLLGIYRIVHSTRDLTIHDIVFRIINNLETFSEKYKSRSASEQAYIDTKSFISEL